MGFLTKGSYRLCQQLWTYWVFVRGKFWIFGTYIYPCFPKISGNLGRQYGEAMKFLDEDVRQKQTEKQWREHLRIAWEISPALAVFLPQRMNNSPILQILQKEVTRYVRTYPEEVCHIPR